MRNDIKEMDIHKKVLITGSAGFIGFHLSQKLLELGCRVIGIDDVNDYYSTDLKKERLKILHSYQSFQFMKGDLAEKGVIERVFEEHQPEIVVHLAAQPGVRYSLENPDAYIESNIIGFFRVLEACRNSRYSGNVPVEHLIFASSSSVYGNQQKVPFSVEDSVDKPISLYAATKKSNELMAYTYSHLFEIPMTGLRFFTVYGPYGRPDMAYFSFAEKIVSGEKISIFNQGDLYRDFTYIDDIVQGIMKVLNNPPKQDCDGERYKVYNIGNNKPVKVMDFVKIMETLLGREANKEYLPMQPGDVYQTYADVKEMENDFGFRAKVEIEDGLERFIIWFKQFRGYQ